MIHTSQNIEDLITRVGEYLPKEKASEIRDAYEFAAGCHKDQQRKSGGPYIEHPLGTAIFLADLNLDVTTLSAALLHDVVEDCGVTLRQLTKRFGKDVSKLVDGVTKLTRMEIKEIPDSLMEPEDRLQAETLRKMLVAMAEDVRVVLIKLADRLHNMHTLGALSKTKRDKIARETLEIYAPLAHRLGIWDIKWRLEDMSFRYLQPTEYKQISKMLSSRRTERESYISNICETLSTDLKGQNINSHVIGRPKHIYSIYQKSMKYAELGKNISDIHDLYAIRVLVQNTSDCYNTLGIVHNLWRPIPGQFDDYIASPKENMYQSLHTTVMCKDAIPLEVQIRTYEMHQMGEYGVAAHWRYKGGVSNDTRFEEKMAWLRQLLEWQKDMIGTDEFLESVKTDLFKDQVFVYTPKGKIIELPAGATPIDFAYRIHTELGHGCIGAKVNGTLAPLDYQLENGDTIEIMATKIPGGPSLDWLNQNLGYTRTASARSSIRQWFRRQSRKVNIQVGRDLLKKESRRLDIKMDPEEIAAFFKLKTRDEFLVSLGAGEITINQIVNRIFDRPDNKYPSKTIPITVSSSYSIKVLGVGDLLTRIATCCSPLPGENIVGYITRTRGVTVHKIGCLAIDNEKEPERLVAVEWGVEQELYPIRLMIEAEDRVGLLRDISAKVSEEGINIGSSVTDEHDDGTATITLMIYTAGIDQLGRVFSKIEGIKGIISVVRNNRSSSQEQKA